MVEISTPIMRAEIAPTAELPTLPQLQETWNGMESFFQGKDSPASERIQQNVKALNTPDSGYDGKDPNKKITVDRGFEADRTTSKVDNLSFNEILIEEVDELERIAKLQPAEGASEADITKIQTQKDEANRLLKELDKSLVVTTREGKSMTRAEFKAQAKAKAESSTGYSDMNPDEQERQIVVEEKALLPQYELTYKEVYKAEELPKDLKQVTELADGIINNYKQWLVDEIIRTGAESDKQSGLIQELMLFATARQLTCDTPLGAYGKYLVLRQLYRQHGPQTAQALAGNFGVVLQALQGQEVQEQTGGVTIIPGAMTGWEKGLTAEEVAFFKDTPDSFAAIARVNELYYKQAVTTDAGGQEQKGTTEGLAKFVDKAKPAEAGETNMFALYEQCKGLPNGEKIFLEEVRTRTGIDTVELNLYLNKDRLGQLTHGCFGKEVVTTEDVIKTEVSPENRRRLIEKIKQWGKKVPLIGGLLLLVMMLMSMDEGGGQQAQH